jgi:hypothetical protein
LKGTGARIIGTVHDEIILEAPEALAEEMATRLETIMQQAGQTYLTRVPIEVEVVIAKDWGGRNKHQSQAREDRRHCTSDPGGPEPYRLPDRDRWAADHVVEAYHPSARAAPHRAAWTEMREASCATAGQGPGMVTGRMLYRAVRTSVGSCLTPPLVNCRGDPQKGPWVSV